jgi:hypothetical protein
MFHTLRSKLGIKDSEQHLVLKYRNGLHRYIHIEMDFLDISSLGATYRYVVKIEQKFKQQSKQEFGFVNMPQQKHGKGKPNSHNKGQSKESRSEENHSKPPAKKGDGKFKKDPRKWCEFHKIPWHNTDECRSKQSLVVELEENELEPDLNSDSKHNKGKHIVNAKPTATITVAQSNQKNQRSLRRGSVSFIHRYG